MQHALRDYQRGDLARAEHLCRQVLGAKPDYFDALHLLGLITGCTRRTQESVELLSRAVAVKRNVAEAFNHLGVALNNAGRHEESLESCKRAIALKSGYADAWYNQGVAQGDLRQHAAALASYDRAIALKSDHAEAHNNRGVALCDLLRHAEAPASYERAIALRPDFASAHRNLAQCQLLLGNFARGWSENEWRWKTDRFIGQQRGFTQPLWLGKETLAGKTILLHSEQGLGDTLQFCRYAKLVTQWGARVVLEVQPPLAPLLARMEGVAEVIPKGAELPAFDYHCPLLSLPLAFGTDMQSIPAEIPYLRADSTRVAAWQMKLGASPRPRVGLAWSGSVALRHDARSLALEELTPLLDDTAEWVSLQKEVRDSDQALLASRGDIRHYGDALTDFAETAALVESMDAVVTIDTSIAHLAGAMGKPVWILLGANPDWRWGLGRGDSPWYPTARLVRRTATGDWGSVVAAVRSELAAKLRP